MGLFPMMGNRCVSNARITLSECRGDHVFFLACHSRAMSSNEVIFSCGVCRGSIPRDRLFSNSSRAFLASARDISGYTPKARVVSLPLMVRLNRQYREPLV